MASKETENSSENNITITFPSNAIHTAADIWNGLPADLILGLWVADYIERCAALYMHLICTTVCICMRFITVKNKINLFLPNY